MPYKFLLNVVRFRFLQVHVRRSLGEPATAGTLMFEKLLDCCRLKHFATFQNLSPLRGLYDHFQSFTIDFDITLRRWVRRKSNCILSGTVKGKLKESLIYKKYFERDTQNNILYNHSTAEITCGNHLNASIHVPPSKDPLSTT
jgi:hypothetical protein